MPRATGIFTLRVGCCMMMPPCRAVNLQAWVALGCWAVPSCMMVAAVMRPIWLVDVAWVTVDRQSIHVYRAHMRALASVR
eukprot:4445839-Alexandrium_andersonii.AAC.1